jgi:anti-sigma factor RsiW
MSELDRAWATTQFEAMADDSLSPQAKRRMLALMASDPGIAREVRQARALRHQLKGLSRAPVPRRLLSQLWRIPSAERPARSYWAPAGMLATLAVAVLGLNLLLTEPGLSPQELARQDAVQDFAIAVAYLQRSADLAQFEVNEAVADSVRGAVAVSRQAMGRADVRINDGDVDNED